MGSVFKLISDDALTDCQEDFGCHKCQSKDVVGYNYSVEIEIDGNLEQLDYLCASCILDNDLEPLFLQSWNPTLERCNDSEEAALLLKKTPSLPCFIQQFDWPVCCGQLTEFQGVPESHEERKDMPNKFHFWNKGFKDYGSVYDFTPESEFLQDIGIFSCSNCQQKTFTFQFT